MVPGRQISKAQPTVAGVAVTIELRCSGPEAEATDRVDLRFSYLGQFVFEASNSSWPILVSGSV
jgi:hypothetical protein